MRTKVRLLREAVFCPSIKRVRQKNSWVDSSSRRIRASCPANIPPKLPTVVDAHQGPIPTHIHPAADPTRRYRVERLLETDVMIRMHLTLRPLRCVEPRHTPWNQHWPFLLVKDLDRYRSSCPMDAPSGKSRHQRWERRHTSSMSMNVSPFQKRSRAYRTVFSTIGLSLGCCGRAASGKNPRYLAYSKNVLFKRGVYRSAVSTAALKLSITIRRGQPPKNSNARSKQSMTDFRSCLNVGTTQLQPAVVHGHDERPQHARTATPQFLKQSQSAEVHFARFTRHAFLSAHRHRRSSKLAPLPREAIQGGIRRHDAFAAK
jgi:hypothetical protein